MTYPKTTLDVELCAYQRIIREWLTDPNQTDSWVLFYVRQCRAWSTPE